MEEYEIRAVKVVNGESLNPRWHTKMQIITTDKGDFIDNISKEQFGYYNIAKPGYDWNQLIGQKISNVKIFYSRGYEWINYQ